MQATFPAGHPPLEVCTCDKMISDFIQVKMHEHGSSYSRSGPAFLEPATNVGEVVYYLIHVYTVTVYNYKQALCKMVNL